MPAFYYSTTPCFEDAEIWYGPHVTREAAAIAAGQRFPGVGFWTAEAVPQTNALDIFEPSMFEPDGCIADVFEDVNAELLGEDGEGGPNHWDTDAVAALVKRLNYQFTAWAREHGYQRGWMLDVSAEEWTPACNPAPTGRLRPVLSLAMGGSA
ncbi:hypothetical protein NPJ82_06005 [Sphingomonas sp. NY01]|uniref:hypothetical protein n=1 Tax=Sphingomonas sp. NY01 TaxID=2968057 RepID=UPI00315C856B